MAGQLVPEQRVTDCHRLLASNASGAAVVAREGRAGLRGLQTCGSVWACPVCAPKVAAARQDELNRLLAWGRAEKLVPVMLTLTARHGLEDALAALLKAMKGSKRRLHRSKPWERLKPRLVGHVTATEVTDGLGHGWHPHFHVILLVRAGSRVEALELVEELRVPWMRALAAEGLDGNGAAFQVQGAAEAGHYIAKWGVAEELALSGSKRGRKGGRTPWQLLTDATGGARRAAWRWQEYARAMKGHRQLVWSPGLKVLAGIEERTDEELAAAEERQRETETVARIPAETWRALMRRNRRRAVDVRGEILACAEATLASTGAAAVQGTVDELIARILAPPGG